MKCSMQDDPSFVGPEISGSLFYEKECKTYKCKIQHVCEYLEWENKSWTIAKFKNLKNIAKFTRLANSFSLIQFIYIILLMIF